MLVVVICEWFVANESALALSLQMFGGKMGLGIGAYSMTFFQQTYSLPNCMIFILGSSLVQITMLSIAIFLDNKYKHSERLKI